MSFCMNVTKQSSITEEKEITDMYTCLNYTMHRMFILYVHVMYINFFSNSSWHFQKWQQFVHEQAHEQEQA